MSKLRTLLSEEEIFSGLTPDGREKRCSNCFDTKLPPPSALVSCLASTISTSPSVLMLSSCKRTINLVGWQVGYRMTAGNKGCGSIAMNRPRYHFISNRLLPD